MEYKTIRHTTDILAIGGGIGGLVSGILAAEAGAKVIIVDMFSLLDRDEGILNYPHFLFKKRIIKK